MLTEMRWQKEQELMQDVFPQFRPFSRGASFGFEGHLKGPRSGQFYRVVMEADKVTYPQSPPNVDMRPKIGENWIAHRGHRVLCMLRQWRPARSTFANTLLTVLRFIDEHDGRSGFAPPYQCAEQTAARE